MTSKEALEQLRKYNGIGLCGDYTLFEPIEKDLEILEIIKKVGILDLVFSDDPYCNLVITNRDVINVDYDGCAPDIEMTWEDYEKIKEWLENERQEN